MMMPDHDLSDDLDHSAIWPPLDIEIRVSLILKAIGWLAITISYGDMVAKIYPIFMEVNRDPEIFI